MWAGSQWLLNIWRKTAEKRDQHEQNKQKEWGEIVTIKAAEKSCRKKGTLISSERTKKYCIHEIRTIKKEQWENKKDLLVIKNMIAKVKIFYWRIIIQKSKNSSRR